MRTALCSSILALLLAACHDSGSSTASLQPGALELSAVRYGQLVDVYGLRIEQGVKLLELFRRDVLVGPDIRDQRRPSVEVRDEQILYDFLLPDAETLQPRLLITRELGTEAFDAAFAVLDANCPLLRPARGEDFGLVPRDAALRLDFTAPLPVQDEFFHERDASGRLTGLKNLAAVQLLERRVAQPSGETSLHPLPLRVAVHGQSLILDPVLLGSEAQLHGRGRSFAGMPASRERELANVFVSLALDGAQRIPGLRADDLVASDDQGRAALLYGFRSGHPDDDTAELQRGMLRWAQAPQLLADLPLYLEGVDRVSEGVSELRLFKDGLVHELDRFDQLSLYTPQGQLEIPALSLLGEPVDDEVNASVQRVRVLVRSQLDENGQDLLEAMDPRNQAGFPAQPGKERSEWLRQHAPRGRLRAPFTMQREQRGLLGLLVRSRDEARNFLRFAPSNGLVGHYAVGEKVSAMAGGVLQFSRPMDHAAIDPLEELFFATRDLFDPAQIAVFQLERGIHPSQFSQAKYRTPHLIHARLFTEDEAGTLLRLQPTLGFYLDEAMREAAAEDEALPFAQRRFHYHLHLKAGLSGLRDLAGRPLQLFYERAGVEPVPEGLVMEFELDCRRDAQGQPYEQDNLAVTVARRFAADDEDERPSYYQPAEVAPLAGARSAPATAQEDFFGAVTVSEGRMRPFPPSRITRVFDEHHPAVMPSQADPVLRWCPWEGPGGFSVRQEIGARVTANFPTYEPLNHYGCRMQVVWREIDLELSRTDPGHFNLEVEQMYWAPAATHEVKVDEFERASLYLGHAEYRPEDCVGGAAFPSMPVSGVWPTFDSNFVHNLDTQQQVEEKPQPHPAYENVRLKIHPKDLVTSGRGETRFVPLPEFEDARQTAGMDDPYFVWRDERVMVQGGDSGLRGGRMRPFPYMLSPFLGGRGDAHVEVQGLVRRQPGRWNNAQPESLGVGGSDTRTGGLVGSIALPLLADFWIYPDAPSSGAGVPWHEIKNAWQVTMNPLSRSGYHSPGFVAFSAGYRGGSGRTPRAIGPADPEWGRAAGGFDPNGSRTNHRSRNQPWVMVDFQRRMAVATAGFVDLRNPHRVAQLQDPRLGPFGSQHSIAHASHDLRVAGGVLPPGTSVVTEFRAAGQHSGGTSSWPLTEVVIEPGGIKYDNPVTELNLPNDPRKAGDAHIRHYDNRLINGKPREHWLWQYQRNLTGYQDSLEGVLDPAYLQRFAGPHETFGRRELRYLNWRFLLRGNLESMPVQAPELESFVFSYRLQ